MNDSINMSIISGKNRYSVIIWNEEGRKMSFSRNIATSSIEYARKVDTKRILDFAKLSNINEFKIIKKGDLGTQTIDLNLLKESGINFIIYDKTPFFPYIPKEAKRTRIK